MPWRARLPPAGAGRDEPVAAGATDGGALASDVAVDDRWIELDYGPYRRPAAWRHPDERVGAMAGRTPRSPRRASSHFGDLGARVRAACDELSTVARSAAVVVVTHVSPIKAALAWALGVGDAHRLAAVRRGRQREPHRRRRRWTRRAVVQPMRLTRRSTPTNAAALSDHRGRAVARRRAPSASDDRSPVVGGQRPQRVRERGGVTGRHEQALTPSSPRARRAVPRQATTGRPAATASATTVPYVSWWLISANTSAPAYRSDTAWRSSGPWTTTRPRRSAACRRSRTRVGVTLVDVVPARRGAA